MRCFRRGFCSEVILRAIFTLLLLSSAIVSVPVEAMETTLVSLSPADKIVKGLVKKVGGSLGSGGRPSAKSLTKEFKTELFRAKGKLRGALLPRPLDLDLSFSMRPLPSRAKLFSESKVSLTLSEEESSPRSGSVEMALGHSEDNTETLTVNYKFSF